LNQNKETFLSEKVFKYKTIFNGDCSIPLKDIKIDLDINGKLCFYHLDDEILFITTSGIIDSTCNGYEKYGIRPLCEPY